MARKQKDLPGMERQQNEEVENAAEAYVKSRDKRVKASEHEVADKTALIEVMRKHKLNVYKDEERGVVVTITPGKPNVKVKELGEEEPANDDAEEEAA